MEWRRVGSSRPISWASHVLADRAEGLENLLVQPHLLRWGGEAQRGGPHACAGSQWAAGERCTRSEQGWILLSHDQSLWLWASYLLQVSPLSSVGQEQQQQGQLYRAAVWWWRWLSSAFPVVPGTELPSAQYANNDRAGWYCGYSDSTLSNGY